MLGYWGGWFDWQGLVHTVAKLMLCGCASVHVHHDLLLCDMQGLCKAAPQATSWLLCKLCMGAIGLH